MKKLKYLPTIILAIVILLAIGTNVKAVSITGINTMASKANYTTGESIYFQVQFGEDTSGISGDLLTIKFSESNTEIPLSRVNMSGTGAGLRENTLMYQYTIKAEDKGNLLLVKYSISGAEDVSLNRDSGVKANTNNTSESGNTGETGSGTGTGTGTNTGSTGTGTGTESGGSSGTGTGSESGSDALTWDDGSKINAEMSIKDLTASLSITGLNSKRKYYIFVSNGKVEPTVSEIGEIKDHNYISQGKDSIEFAINKYYEKSGDIYIWIYESQYYNGEQHNKYVVSKK